MTIPIYLVAIGARTPLGLLAESSAAAVRARITRLREHPFLVSHAGEPIIGAIDGRLDPKLLGWSRIAKLACAALTEVSEKLAAKAMVARTVRVLVALPEARPGFSDMDVSSILAELGAALPATFHRHGVEPECVGRGHAAGLHAISIAADRIGRGEAELCIVGGADSYFHPETIGWLLERNVLARCGARSGFSPGEGAGFLALASEVALQRWQLDTLGTVRGAASAYEKNCSPETQDVNLGEALSKAVMNATAGLSLPREMITDVFCDINGERLRSEEWGFTLLRNSRVFVDGSSYCAPASEWGDQGAASGTLFAVLSARSWQRGYARGAYALMWAASMQGLRSAVVLQKPGR